MYNCETKKRPKKEEGTFFACFLFLVSPKFIWRSVSVAIFFFFFFNLKSGFSCGGFHLLLFSKSILEQLSTDCKEESRIALFLLSLLCNCYRKLMSRSVIVTENSCHALNQSDAKLKPITT